MTLVEVVASLALLGALLGTAVIAKGRLTRQWSAAQDRVEAIAALDARLKAWQVQTAPSGEAAQSGMPESDVIGVEPVDAAWPTSGQGPLAVEPWWWRAEPIDQPHAEALGVRVIRYTAFNPEDAERYSSNDERGRVSGGAAVIDVLVYDGEPVGDLFNPSGPPPAAPLDRGAAR